MEEEWGDHSDDAVANRPADNGPGATFGADVEREDLGGVEPWSGEPGGAEGGGVEEGHGGDAGAVGFLAGSWRIGEFVEDTRDEKDQGHANGAPDHGGATAESVKGIDGKDDGEHVADIVEAGEEFAELFTETGVREQIDGVNGDDTYANEFLHDLQPNG